VLRVTFSAELEAYEPGGGVKTGGATTVPGTVTITWLLATSPVVFVA
jgi:hypothetical protein